MSDSIKGKTIKGVGWSFADNILNQGISFLIGIVLARLLTPEEYGLIGIIAIFIAVFNSIVDSGFSNALIRKTDAGDIDYNTVFYTNLVLSIVLFWVLFFVAPPIAKFFNQPQLSVLTRVMAIIIIINAFAIIQRTILVKNVDFKTQTKASLISSILSGVFGISMALLGFGVWSIVAQQIARQLIYCIFLWLYSRWYPKLLFSMQSFRELYDYGWKILVSGLIDTVWKEIYSVIIGKCYSAETLGQYTRANQFASIFSSNLTNVVQRVSYPVLSAIQNERERLKSAYKKIIKVTMLVTFCCMLGLASVAKPMILSLIGEQWMQAVPLLQIICFNMMLYPLHAINLNMLQVQGRSDLLLKLEIIKKLFGTIPLLLGIFIGVYWMLWGSVVMGFVSYYLNAYYSGKYLNYSIIEQIRDIIPSFLVAGTMAIVVYMLNYWLTLSSIFLLLIQMMTGFILVIILCELFKLDSYIEIKGIALNYINKYKNGE